jgi:hypothetical protein
VLILAASHPMERVKDFLAGAQLHDKDQTLLGWLVQNISSTSISRPDPLTG